MADGKPVQEDIDNMFLRRPVPYSTFTIEETGEEEKVWTTFNESNYPLAAALGTIGYTMPGNATIVIQQVAAAASLLFMLPVILLFFIGQRFLIEVVTSGVKE